MVVSVMVILIYCCLGCFYYTANYWRKLLYCCGIKYCLYFFIFILLLESFVLEFIFVNVIVIVLLLLLSALFCYWCCISTCCIVIMVNNIVFKYCSWHFCYCCYCCLLPVVLEFCPGILCGVYTNHTDREWFQLLYLYST